MGAYFQRGLFSRGAYYSEFTVLYLRSVHVELTNIKHRRILEVAGKFLDWIWSQPEPEIKLTSQTKQKQHPGDVPPRRPLDSYHYLPFYG